MLGDVVHMAGQVANNHYTTGSSNNIFTLPADFRPLYSVSYDIRNRFDGANGTLTINTSGVVSVWFEAKSDDPVGFSLDGLSYPR